MTVWARVLDRGHAVMPSWFRSAIGPCLLRLEQFLHWLPAIFLATAAPTVLVLALMTPPGDVADEPAHFARAASLLHGELVGRRISTATRNGQTYFIAGVDIDPALNAVNAFWPPPVVAKAKLDPFRAARWTGKTSFVPTAAAEYFPVLYVPGAVAIALSRAVGASPFAAFYAARLANALCYLLLGAIALAVARRGRLLLFATLSLPMSVSLAASASQDGLLIAVACAGMALLTAAEEGAKRALPFACAALGIVMLAKPPYLPLAAVLLTDARLVDCRAWGRRFLLGAAIAAPAMLWSVLAALTVSAPHYMAPYHPGPLYAGSSSRVFLGTNGTAQLHVLLAAPLRLVALPVASFIHDLPRLKHELIGVLGWLDVVLSPGVYLGWQIALVAAIGASVAAPLGMARRGAARHGPALMRLGLVMSIVLIYLTMYVAWTPVGMDGIDGVQGRYFLPLLPFLALAFPGPRWLSLPHRWRVGVHGALLLPAIVMAASCVVILPLVVASRMYPH